MDKDADYFSYLFESQETKTQTDMDSWSLDSNLNPHVKTEQFHIIAMKMSVNRIQIDGLAPTTGVRDFPLHLTLTIHQ